MVILLTLNKSKKFNGHFADFEQVKNFSSHFTTLNYNYNYRFMNFFGYYLFILYKEKSKTFL